MLRELPSHHNVSEGYSSDIALQKGVFNNVSQIPRVVDETHL
jgi:hypothetical protein